MRLTARVPWRMRLPWRELDEPPEGTKGAGLRKVRGPFQRKMLRALLRYPDRFWSQEALSW